MLSLEFFVDIILPAAMWFWVARDCNRNEYWRYFLRVKAALPPLCADFLAFWECQTPGILRVCPGQYRDCFTVF
jgi:hypothetical protein